MLAITDEEIGSISALLEGHADEDAAARAVKSAATKRRRRAKFAAWRKLEALLPPEEQEAVKAEARAALSPGDRAGLDDERCDALSKFAQARIKLVRARLAAAGVTA